MTRPRSMIPEETATTSVKLTIGERRTLRELCELLGEPLGPVQISTAIRVALEGELARRKASIKPIEVTAKRGARRSEVRERRELETV